MNEWSTYYLVTDITMSTSQEDVLKSRQECTRFLFTFSEKKPNQLKHEAFTSRSSA